MGFFDWFNRGEKQYNITDIIKHISSLAEADDNLQDMQSAAGIDEAFKKADILQSIELTCKDFSKNHKVFTKNNQTEVLQGVYNLKGQAFTDVYSELIAEKVKYRVAVARIVTGGFSGKQTLECLRLSECSFDYGYVQYPTILDLKHVEYRNVKYLPEELLFFGNTTVLVERDYGKQGIEYAVSNLINDYQAKHAIIAGRGAMGIISPAQTKTDQMSFGAKLDATEKKEIERGFTRKYGLLKGKTQFMVASVPLNFNSTSMNVQELGISEDKKENITAICSHLKYPTDLYFNATTYENQATARAAVYNGILIPFAMEDAVVLSKWLKIEVEIDYSHVAELQNNEQTKVNRNNTVVSYCSAAVAAQLMTLEQAQKELGNYIDLENGN
jgi:hypothetical protein